jgi:serine/threonine-protein kinase
MLLGSPLYMSPEQMRSSKHIDARTDIWGLGAIAYEMLSGHVPFEASSLMELCFKVAQEDAEDLAKLRPDLPAELCKGVMRCLEKDVEKRWANVAELAAAIEPFAGSREQGSAERVADMLKVRTTLRSAPDFDEVARAAAASAPPKETKKEKKIDDALVDSKETTAPSSRRLLSQPEVAPAAWGTTRAEAKAKQSRTAMYAVGAVAICALVGVGWAATRDKTPAAGLAPTSTLPSDPPPPVVELTGGLKAAPPATGTPTTTETATTTTTATPTPSSAPPPDKRPRVPPQGTGAKATPTTTATATTTAAPADSGGFIKVRE